MPLTLTLTLTERLVEPLGVLGFHWNLIADIAASGPIALGPGIDFSDLNNSMYVAIISAFV